MSSGAPGEAPGENAAGAEQPGDQDGEAPRALVAGHGNFAAGVISAVTQIGGRASVFVGMSNTGLGAAEITEAMRVCLDESGIGVIFTDLPAGSMTIAARRLLRERPDLVVVTGANLATLLDFAFHADLPAALAAEHAAEKGRASLTIAGGHGAPRSPGAAGAAGGEGGGGG
jgi:PTS system N-acetylgalactosamine-specific IIA component